MPQFRAVYGLVALLDLTSSKMLQIVTDLWMVGATFFAQHARALAWHAGVICHIARLTMVSFRGECGEYFISHSGPVAIYRLLLWVYVKNQVNMNELASIGSQNWNIYPKCWRECWTMRMDHLWRCRIQHLYKIFDKY